MKAQTISGAITITGSPLTMTVPACIASGSAGSAKQNVPYACSLTASNGSGSGYTFSVVSGTPPAGIASVTSSGVFTGTPTGTSAGTQVVKLVDSSGASVQASITITPASLSSIAVTPVSPSLPTSGTVQLFATGTWSDGSTSDLTNLATWSCTGTGCSSVSSSGLFTASGSSGTPTVKAVFNSVTDDGGSGVTVTVTSNNPQILTSATLCPGQIGQMYSETTGSCTGGVGEQLTASGGTPPYTWSLTSGSLQGLTLSSGGLISGTPSGAGGSSSPVIKVMDSGSNTNSVTFSLAIATLSSVAVSCTPSPACQTITQGQTVQLKATGTYSDSSTADVTRGGSAQPILDVGSAAGSNFTGTSIASIATANSVNVPTGALGFALCRMAAAGTSVTPTDTAGNTWNAIGSLQTINSAAKAEIFYSANMTANSADFLTCTPNASEVNQSADLLVESGVATSTPLDVAATAFLNSTANNSLTANSFTTTNNTDLIIMAGALQNHGRTFTAGPGLELEQVDPDGSAALFDETVSSTGSYAPTATFSGNTGFSVTFAAAFKAATNGTQWSSGTTSVASVNSAGLVSGLEPGTSVIAAQDGTPSGTLTITVNASTQSSDTSLVLAPSPGNGIVGGGTVTFTATGNSTGNSYTASYVSNNTSVATITTGGLATCVAAGSATITGTAGSLSGQATLNCSAAGTASVLPGCTVTSANAINFGSGGCPASLPSPWSLVLAESFESGTLGSSNEYISSGGNDSITASFAHTGTHALLCSIGFDDAACVLGVHSGVIGSSNHVYISYWRQMASNACGDTEIYFARVFGTNSAGFTDLMDTQNNTSPLNTCLTTMSYEWFSAQPQSLSGFGSDPNQYAGPPWPLPIGTWEHVEFEFKGSTCSGSTSNKDGLFNLWVNGKLQMNKANVDLNGCATGFSSVGMGMEAGGVFTYLNASLQSINPPKGAFNTWIDDVIFLNQ